MNITVYDKETKNEEADAILRIMANHGLYNRQLFMEFLTICSDSYAFSDINDDIFNTIFDKALVSALLCIKLNLQRNISESCFSTGDLAESILGNSANPDTVKAITRDIEKYNGKQSRIFYRHSLKNYGRIVETLPEDLRSSYPNRKGNRCEYERAILEIEYLLKDSDTYAKRLIGAAEKINMYALDRIHSMDTPDNPDKLFPWRNLSIEDLQSMRRAYKKIRLHFFQARPYKKGIPGYCYEQYLRCMNLIYRYVGFYTPPSLLDIAYKELDDTYQFYSYAASRSEPYYYDIFDQIGVFKRTCFNEFTIPSRFEPYFNTVYHQSVMAIGKMVFYLHHHESPLWTSDINGITQMLTRFIADIEWVYPFPSHDNPFIVMQARPSFKPSFDEWILYNALWNDSMIITQKEFTDKFILNSTSLHNDSVMSTILFALESMGVSVNRNSDDYEKLSKVIEDPKKQGMDDLLISRVLSWFFSDRIFLSADIDYFNKITDSDYSENFRHPDDVQKKCVDALCKKIDQYYRIIMGAPDMSKKEKINHDVPSSSIYQFFYRNWFGLGTPDIFPNSKCCNHAIIDRFLSTYDLNLKVPFNQDSTTWINCAKKHLEDDDPLSYKLYEDYKKNYTK